MEDGGRGIRSPPSTHTALRTIVLIASCSDKRNSNWQIFQFCTVGVDLGRQQEKREEITPVVTSALATRARPCA